jgi:hypothetical protein
MLSWPSQTQSISMGAGCKHGFQCCCFETEQSKTVQKQGMPFALAHFCFTTKCNTESAVKAIDNTCVHDPICHTDAKLDAILVYIGASMS